MKVLFLVDILQVGLQDLCNDASKVRNVAYKESNKKNFNALFFIHQYVYVVNFFKVRCC